MQQHHLFPITVYTNNIILDIPSMISFLYSIKQVDKGVKISNKGGWQSQSNLHLQPQFSPLVNYVQNLLKKEHKVKINILHMWGNISSKYHYNTIHTHGKYPNIWSAVYYLQTYNKSGGLTLYNMCDININQKFFFKKGDLIFFPSSLPHSVEANLEDKDRISVAFNFQINQINGQ